MIRYTARNGTNFHFDPVCGELRVIGTGGEAESVELDLQDLREFLQHLDDRSEALSEEDVPSDADITAVAAD